MLKNMKTFMAGFLSCAVLVGSFASVLADGNDVNITAILSGSIKMKLYGKDFTPQETDGTYIKPISYNGRTYLPVRALAEALNIPVEWDGPTSTVWLGGKIESIAVNDTSLYENSNATIITTDTDKLTTTSKIYKWGITNKEVMKNVFYKCSVKPNGKYKHFTASLFLDDKATGDVIMEFRKEAFDGAVIRSVTLKPGVTQDIDIDIGGVEKLYIYSSVLNSKSGTVSKLIIGEPTFKNGEAAVVISNPLK